MKYTVRTPVAGVNEKLGGVAFVDGCAEIDEELNPAELRYCLAAGYSFDPPYEPAVADEPLVDADGDGAPDLPKKSASADTWRSYAVAVGMSEEEAAGLSRDELVARYTKEDGQ